MTWLVPCLPLHLLFVKLGALGTDANTHFKPRAASAVDCYNSLWHWVSDWARIMPGHVMPNSVLPPSSWPVCQAGYQIPERGACKNIDPPLESNPGEPRKGLRNIYFNKGCQQSQNGQSKDLCRRSQAYISPPFPESSLYVVSLLHVFPHLTGRCWQGCTGLPCSPAGLLFLNRLLPGRLPPLLAFEGFTLW